MSNSRENNVVFGVYQQLEPDYEYDNPNSLLNIFVTEDVAKEYAATLLAEEPTSTVEVKSMDLLESPPERVTVYSNDISVSNLLTLDEIFGSDHSVISAFKVTLDDEPYALYYEDEKIPSWIREGETLRVTTSERDDTYVLVQGTNKEEVQRVYKERVDAILVANKLTRHIHEEK